MESKKLIITLVTFSCFSSLAAESPHRLELRGALGTIDAARQQGASTEELNDLSTGHIGIAYNYKVNKNFSVGIEKQSGDSEVFIEISDLFTDSKLDYDLTNIVGLAEFALSERNEVYGKLIAYRYDYDVIDDGEVVGSGDGSSIGFGIGWRYTFDLGVGVSMGYEAISLGDDVDIRGISWALSYQF